MKVIKLRLKGIMQSWGKPEPWVDYRRTDSVPTSSAILGIIACSMGIKRGDDDELSSLAESFSIKEIFSVSRFVQMTDTQTARPLSSGMEFRAAHGGKRIGVGNTMLFSKDYLQDADFIVSIEGDDAAIDNIKYYLDHPVYPYYLGRYCCTPSERVVCSDSFGLTQEGR